MRGTVLLGTALLVVGGTIFLRGLSAPKPEAAKTGEVPVSAEARSSTVPWAIGLTIVAGIALVTTGTRRKA